NNQLIVGNCPLTIGNYNANGRINDVLAPMIIGQLPNLDAKIAEQLNLLPQAEAAWNNIAEPIEVASRSWLLVNPLSVAIIPVTGNDHTLVSGLTLTAMPTISYGDKPSAQHLALPTPTVAQPAHGFHIILKAEAPYDAISSKLRGSDGIVGRVYKADAHHQFTITDARVYGFGDEAIMQVTVSGWKSGSIFFSGKPKIDPASYDLYIDHFDYSVESKAVFVRLVERFPGFHERLRAAMLPYTRYPLANKIDDLRVNLQQALNRDLANGVRSRGRIDTLRPLTVAAQIDRFVGYVSIDGELEIEPQAT
ncbi:MAG: DUF4403 family protein, partial [Deltaproteobacteria bacterium]|nr:DUF4403 family protein [Deltaproteobacteria bacterium]